MILPPARSTLFPYTTLFRSVRAVRGVRRAVARAVHGVAAAHQRSEEHTSELQSRRELVCRLLLEKKNNALGSPDAGADPRAASQAGLRRTMQRVNRPVG